jgi:hypothetical protein
MYCEYFLGYPYTKAEHLLLTYTTTVTYTYTIPKCLSNGEYLLRIQSLAIHNPYPAGIPQVSMVPRMLTILHEI